MAMGKKKFELLDCKGILTVEHVCESTTELNQQNLLPSALRNPAQTVNNQMK